MTAFGPRVLRLTNTLQAGQCGKRSIVPTPVPSKSRTFRGTRTALRERDMAAMRRSASPIGRLAGSRGRRAAPLPRPPSETTPSLRAPRCTRRPRMLRSACQDWAPPPFGHINSPNGRKSTYPMHRFVDTIACSRAFGERAGIVQMCASGNAVRSSRAVSAASGCFPITTSTGRTTSSWITSFQPWFPFKFDHVREAWKKPALDEVKNHSVLHGGQIVLH